MAGTVTGLAAGSYLALTAAQLKTLRACKGDRARRDHVAMLRCERLDVEDAWWFLKTVGGDALELGKSLHRGQMHRIELLDLGQLSTAVAVLGKLDLRAAFFAIDEDKFRYSNVAFWVADQWKREGRTTVLDKKTFAVVRRGLTALTPFVAAATAAQHSVLFTTSY